MRNNCGPIEFINTNEPEARIEATLTVEGKTEEEIAKVLDQFVININVSGKVIDVVEKGYKLGDTIIRFPKVVIGQS